MSGNKTNKNEVVLYHTIYFYIENYIDLWFVSKMTIDRYFLLDYAFIK
jgi:hypothetical protein